MSSPVPRGKPPARRTASRLLFYAHLWIGVVFTAALLIISATGILLNHKRALGLMPDVANEPSGAFSSALSLDSLASIGLQAVALPGAPRAALRTVDRMDVRPRSGYVKVRMRDSASTEVTIDVASGKVLHVGPRGDVFFEKLHSGEIFGGRGIFLSDAAAIALVATMVTGYWLWLVPKLRRPREDAGV